MKLSDNCLGLGVGGGEGYIYVLPPVGSRRAPNRYETSYDTKNLRNTIVLKKTWAEDDFFSKGQMTPVKQKFSTD